MLYLVTKFGKPGRSSSSSPLFLVYFLFIFWGRGGGGCAMHASHHMGKTKKQFSHFLSSEVPTAFNFRFFSCSMLLVIAISLGSSPAIHQMAYGT